GPVDGGPYPPLWGEVEDASMLNFVEHFDRAFYPAGTTPYASFEGTWSHVAENPMQPYPLHHSMWDYMRATDTCAPGVDDRLFLPAQADDPLDLRELTHCELRLWAAHALYPCTGCLGGDNCRLSILRYDRNRALLGETDLFAFPEVIDASCG